MKKTNILIVGAGKGGLALIDAFHESETVNILGIVDTNANAPAFEPAKVLNIPTGSDYKKFLKKKNLNEVINVTGSEKVQKELLKACPPGVDVVSGHTAKLVWDLIGEHRRAEETLKSLARFADENPNPVMRAAKNGVILYSNSAGEKLLSGWSSGIGKTLPHHWRESLQEALESGETKYREVKCEDKLFSFTMVPIRDAGYVNLYGRDVTERKKSEEELKKFYLQLDQIFQSVGDGMFAVDKDMKVSRANDAFLGMLGASRKDLEEKDCHEVMGKELCDVNREIVEKIFSGEGRVERDVTVSRKDGIKIPCILTATPLDDVEGNVIGVIETLKDITERKSAEKTLLENIRLKSNFTSMVSHELRTPLTAIKEGIGIVLDGSAGEINEDQKDFLDTAKRNVDRLARLINDVLDFTKLRGGKMRLKMAEDDISTPIKEVVKSQGPVAKDKGLYLKAEIGPGMPNLRFDSDKMIQVITNLVNNAIKFTKEGGVTIVAEVENENVRVSVSDTGIGIKSVDLPKVFQEFRQLEEMTTGEGGGSGLGLSISKEIIDQHGGRIWAESEYGKGSWFKFTLPVKRKYKILLVDDDEIFLGAYSKFLTKSGYEAFKAKTGMDGINEV
ncbi:MAG: ATP-binding protein, partial [Candidatus Omnitrophota bacterium]